MKDSKDNTPIDGEWKEKFEHWLIHNLQLTSKSNIQLIVDHVERYIAPKSQTSTPVEAIEFAHWMFTYAIDRNRSEYLTEIGNGKLWRDGVGNHFSTKELYDIFKSETI